MSSKTRSRDLIVFLLSCEPGSELTLLQIFAELGAKAGRAEGSLLSLAGGVLPSTECRQR